MLFIESTFKCDNVCGSNLFDNKKWYCGGGKKNLVMAPQMSPCCCFYESSLRRLLRRFSLIFHPEGHASDDSTAANKHKNTDEILIIFLFVRLFRIIPSSCSTTTVTRRWCPCGSVAVWRRGAPRDMPDGHRGGERPEGAPSVCTAPRTGSEITRCWKLYVSNSSIKFGCFVVWNQEPTSSGWSDPDYLHPVKFVSGLSRTVKVLACELMCVHSCVET